MQVATGALSPLLRKLGELLAAEFTLSSRVKKGVQSLATELEMMYVVLSKVGDVPPEQLDPQVRVWAAKVRELSYNMEDAVDAYMVRVYDGGQDALGPNNLKNRVKKFVRRTKKLFSKGKALHQISGAVQDAQELAKELSELRQRYALEAFAGGVGNAIDPRLKAVYRDVTELVGIEGTRDELIEKLLDENEMSKQQLKALSIVGFGGLGKTTLARAVYAKIKSQFSCGVFVSVSRNPDITNIFKKMLYGLDSSKFANINEAVRDNQQLIDELRAFLLDKSEENFITILDGTKQIKNNSDSMVHRLSFQNNMSGLTTHSFDATSMSKLRSITLFRTDVDLIQALSRFKFLRVLDLEGCNLSESSHQIDLRYVENLLHLRYLGLRNTRVSAFPMEIGKLQFLQTLDLRTVGSMEVPSSVVRLGHLMCLHVGGGTRLPAGIGNLVTLEELNTVTMDGTDAIEKEIGKLAELRVLELWWEGDDESACNSLLLSLSNLKKLRSLMIYCVEEARLDATWDSWVPSPHLHTFLFGNCTSTLPRWMNSSLFPVLSCLYIKVNRVRPEVDIQILGKLPALRSLDLATSRAQLTPVERFIIGDDAFPCLRECGFYNFQMWPSMFPQGSMPRLEYISFYARASRIAGGDLDVDMQHLPYLQKVDVALWYEENCLPAVQKAVDMLALAFDAHPNRPILRWQRTSLPKGVLEEEEPAAGMTVSDREGEAVVF
ncbi:disease resistance rpp8-like protein 3 [Hordeum vulgare]|nr:disease resistance rpp8-like protein 3 [Hordeum vulgare]